MIFTHIGGPTLLIEVDGWRLLTDPTFDPPGRRYAFGWGTASRKLEGSAVADVGPVDAVLLSHDHHGDNLDDAGRALLADVPRVVTTIPGARRLGLATGVKPWTATRLEAPGKPTITGPLRYSMTGEQAVQLCGLLRPRVVVPVHYAGWAHFREGRAEVEAAFRRAPPDLRERVRWLEPGVAAQVS